MPGKTAIVLAGLVFTTGVALRAADGPATAAADFAVVTADALRWSPVPDGLGAMYSVVHGDPSEAGTYVIRVRFPAGVMDIPHSHSEDRHVTVIEGEWHAGVGAEFEPAGAMALSAGAYMFHPAGALHFDGARGNSDAVVQIIGEGPVTTTPADPTRPFWVSVK